MNDNKPVLLVLEDEHALKKAIEKLEAELKHVKKISEAEMWEHDLQEFEKEFKA